MKTSTTDKAIEMPSSTHYRTQIQAAVYRLPHRLILLLLFLPYLAACTSLQPVSLPTEQTPAPANAPLWSSLEQKHPDDWFVLLNDGPTALDWRLRAIDSATESIDLQTFLWSEDTVGMQVLEHLVQAANRGVWIRILVDDTFLLNEDEALLALAQHPNIEYRVYNPYKRRTDGFVTRQVLNLAEFSRLDHRMHNKAMVVDNRIAFIGGRNLADEYFGLHSEANFRDLELLAGGKISTSISHSFDAYWNDQWCFPIESISHAKASPAQLEEMLQARGDNTRIHMEEDAETRQARWQQLTDGAVSGSATLYSDEPPGDNPADRGHAFGRVAHELMELFDSAREEILIISAYLIPGPELEGAVERAVARGVRVRILTNSISSNNHLTAHSAYRNHINELLSAGAQLHEVRIDAHDRRIYMLSPVEQKILALHAKALVIDDDRVFIGSANLDPRSLKINTEMGLLVHSKELNKQVRLAVERDYDATNAWQLQFDSEGHVVWIAEDLVLDEQPASSFMQRLEDWFFAHLPIESEM